MSAEAEHCVLVVSFGFGRLAVRSTALVVAIASSFFSASLSLCSFSSVNKHCVLIVSCLSYFTVVVILSDVFVVLSAFKLSTHSLFFTLYFIKINIVWV